MNPNDAAGSIEQAVDALKSAADSIAAGLPSIRKELAVAAELRSKLDAITAALSETSASLDTAAKALDGIEASLLASMESAMSSVHSKNHSVETRKALLLLCTELYEKFAPAGFRFTIPQVGDALSTQLHTPKGKAKSEHGEDTVADVIRWGYSFPSGKGALAEVLIGDASLSEESIKASTASPPTAKAGISMVLDDDNEPSTAKSKKKPDSLFDQLAEAAERNQE